MNVYTVNPLLDERWDALVSHHPKASVFHQRKWLEALAHTYGYGPIAFTTSPPSGELKNAVVFCRVKSWLTGDRLVSLPFSDHCEPLFDSEDELDFMVRYLRSMHGHSKWKYFEIRPTGSSFGETAAKAGFCPISKYFLHTLDLRSDLTSIFRALDKDSVQRRVNRAERANLIERCGRGEDLLKDFHRLFVLTRGRHRVPPIPLMWFKNLIGSLKDSLEIRVAYRGSSAIASILTLRCGDVLYYKYGCSDTQFHYLGAMPWLLWRAVSAAKATGATKFDMGRTQESNPGLLTFKNHWTHKPQEIRYWTFPDVPSLDNADGWRLRLAHSVFSHIPNRALSVVGRLIYRHIG